VKKQNLEGLDVASLEDLRYSNEALADPKFRDQLDQLITKKLEQQHESEYEHQTRYDTIGGRSVSLLPEVRTEIKPTKSKRNRALQTTTDALPSGGLFAVEVTG
jgi:hypothetical protein